MSEFCAKPFSGTLIFALVMNVSPFFLGLAFGASSFSGDDDCPKVGVWLIVQSFTALIHMLMSGYVFRLMQQPFDPNNAKDRDLDARINTLLCDDPGFALYILVALFQFVWLVVGAVWEAQYGSDCENNENTVMVVVLILSWIYVIVAMMVFLLSWCCSCCSTNVEAANRSIEAANQRGEVAVAMVNVALGAARNYNDRRQHQHRGANMA
jgi:hypothetical protein